MLVGKISDASFTGVQPQRLLHALSACKTCKGRSAYSFPNGKDGRYDSFCVAHVPVRVNGRPLSIKKAATFEVLRKLGIVC